MCDNEFSFGSVELEMPGDIYSAVRYTNLKFSEWKNYILGVVKICMVVEAVEMTKITKEGYNEAKENIFVSTNLHSHHYTSI